MAVLRPLQHRHADVVEEDQRDDDDGDLDPQRLLEELAALVDAEQVADHGGQRAEHQKAELDVGEHRALDLALRLFGNQIVGGAEEAHQRPHDQRIGVDHAQDVEGQDLGQEIGQDVDGAGQRADGDLDDEQDHRAGEIVVGDLLRFVFHDCRPSQPALFGGQPWVLIRLVHSRKSIRSFSS